MRVGYCSPFNPLKSGISDFSEELVCALKEFAEIVIFSPVALARKDIEEQFECHKLSELDDDAVRNSLDIIVYQVGNNPQYHGEIVDMLQKHPGIVELHEIGLHHLAAAQTWEAKGSDAYLQLVEYCHGQRGVEIAQAFIDGSGATPWDEHGLDMCMNRHIIESTRGVIVHSEMVKQMVLGICPNIPITCIMHHSEDIVDEPREWRDISRLKLNLPQEQLIFGMFGFATSAKRVIPILDALKRYKENEASDFIYLIVGEPSKELNIDEALRVRGLEKSVRITGFVDLDDFKYYMGACDFCLNLRYPTQGESSGSLHRMLGMGKPIVVTDIGTFSDYPTDVALKVRYDEHEVEDILQAIHTLVAQKKVLQARSEKAVAFAREYCDLRKNAKKYHDFFLQTIHGSWQADAEDVLIGRLCELGLTDKEYISHIWPFYQDTTGVQLR